MIQWRATGDYFPYSYSNFPICLDPKRKFWRRGARVTPKNVLFKNLSRVHQMSIMCCRPITTEEHRGGGAPPSYKSSGPSWKNFAPPYSSAELNKLYKIKKRNNRWIHFYFFNWLGLAYRFIKYNSLFKKILRIVKPPRAVRAGAAIWR